MDGTEDDAGCCEVLFAIGVAEFDDVAYLELRGPDWADFRGSSDELNFSLDDLDFSSDNFSCFFLAWTAFEPEVGATEDSILPSG